MATLVQRQIRLLRRCLLVAIRLALPSIIEGIMWRRGPGMGCQRPLTFPGVPLNSLCPGDDTRILILNDPQLSSSGGVARRKRFAFNEDENYWEFLQGHSHVLFSAVRAQREALFQQGGVNYLAGNLNSTKGNASNSSSSTALFWTSERVLLPYYDPWELRSGATV